MLVTGMTMSREFHHARQRGYRVSGFGNPVEYQLDDRPGDVAEAVSMCCGCRNGRWSAASKSDLRDRKVERIDTRFVGPAYP